MICSMSATRSERYSFDPAKIVPVYEAEFPKKPARLGRKDAVSQKRLDRLEARAIRENAQRVAAKARYDAVRKLIPKQVRMRDIRMARDIKYNVRGAEEQSGVSKTVIGVAMASALLAGGYYTTRRIMRLMNKTEQTVDAANNVCQRVSRLLNSFIDEAKKHMGNMWMIPLYILATWLVARIASTAMRTLFIALVTPFFSENKYVQQIFVSASNEDWSINTKTKKIYAEEQSGAGLTATAIASMITMSYLPKKGEKLMPEILKRMGSMPRAAEGFDAFFKMCMELVEKGVNAICDLCGKDRMHFGDATRKAVMRWQTEAEQAELSLIQQDPTPSVLADVKRVIIDGYGLRSMVSEGALKGIIQRAIDRLEVRMRPYQGVVDATKTFRVEPIFILLSGATGQGKTTLVTRLATSILLLANLCEPQQALSEMWQKGDSKYWESYCGQRCLVMDDCFQQVMVPGMEDTELMQIIRMIGNWSMPLNMASVEVKGKFFFTSPLVIGTTNCGHIAETTASQVIKAPEAVARRVHHALRMVVHGEYAKEGKLNYEVFTEKLKANMRAIHERKSKGETLTTMDIINVFPWDAWIIQPFDFNNGENIGGAIDLKQFVLDVSKKLRTKIADHEAMVKDLFDYNTLLGDVSAIDFKPIEEQAGFTTRAEAARAFMKQMGVRTPDLPEYIDEPPTPLFSRTREYRLDLMRAGFKEARSSFVLPKQPPPLEYEAYKPYVHKKIGLYRQFIARSAGLTRTVSHSGRKLLLLTNDLSGKKWEDVTSQELVSIAKKLFATSMAPDKRPSNDVETMDQWTDRMAIFNDACDKLLELDSFWARMRDATDQEFRTQIAFSDMAGKWQAGFLHFCENHPFIVTFATATVAVLAIRAIIKLLFAAVGALCNMIIGFFAPSAVQEESNVKEQTTSQPKKKRFFHKKSVIAAQSFDGTQREQRHDRVYANTFKMVLEAEERQYIGQVIFLEDRLAVMPQHFRRDFQKLADEGLDHSTQLAFVNCAKPDYVVRMSLKRFMSMSNAVIEDSDVCFVNFGLDTFSGVRALFKGDPSKGHVMSEHHLAQTIECNKAVRLDVCDVSWDAVQSKYNAMRRVLQTPRNEGAKHVAELTVGEHVRSDLLEYNMPTTKGMCGAPLMVSDPYHFGGKVLLGFHIAGAPGLFCPKGFASPITYEMVEEAKKVLGTATDAFDEDMESKGLPVLDVTAEEESALNAAGLLAGSFQLMGKIDKSVALPPTSKLKLSPLGEQQVFGEFDYRPAHLKAVCIDGEWKHPMIEGLRNYQSPLEVRDIDNLSLCVDIATHKFRQLSMHETRKILSFEEAVLGVEGLKLKAINRHTSAGIPYIFDIKRGKLEIFGDGEEYDLTGPKCIELKGRVVHIIESAKAGVRLAHLCTDFLKDELLPSEKVNVGRSRIIAGSPVDYLIAFRQWFGSFMAACFKYPIDTGLCPGINPYNEWWRLANHIKSNGKTKVFDGDFKRFDASEQPYIMNAILDFINRWYDDGPENARIREILWRDLINSRHVTGIDGQLRFIVQWAKSLPSGHPLTTIVNSWYSLICLVICYVQLTGDVKNFWENVSPATFGDDNISGVSDAVADVFNQVTVAEAMKTYLGLTYTSGAKDGTLVPYTTIDRCSFLKRSFYKDDDAATGGWSAPLAKESFLFTAYYYKKGQNFHMETISKLTGTLGELCLHPPELWDEWFPRIKAVMNDMGHEPLYTSRDAWRKETTGRTDFWF